MDIGLIDVDGHSGFPNLALMHLSAGDRGNLTGLQHVSTRNACGRIFDKRLHP